MAIKSLNLKPETIDKFRLLRDPDMDDDQFLSHILNVALGVHCPHLTQIPYVKITTDSRGMMDLDSTLDNLHSVRLGKETDSIILVCTDCMMAKRKTY